MARTKTNHKPMKLREGEAAPLHSRPVWAEVSLGALAYNLVAIKKYVNPPDEKRKTARKVLSIVKGNGYGHGGPQVAKALEKAGSDWFGVTCTEEGIAVRKAGVRGPGVDPDEFCWRRRKAVAGERFDAGDSSVRAIGGAG